MERNNVCTPPKKQQNQDQWPLNFNISQFGSGPSPEVEEFESATQNTKKRTVVIAY